MTDTKLLTHLKSPNDVSSSSSTEFVDQLYVDLFLSDLVDFISSHADEMRDDLSFTDNEKCMTIIMETKNRTSPTPFWKNIVDGASLAFNPFPVRSKLNVLTDVQTLHNDWNVAVMDFRKVYNTTCLKLEHPTHARHERRNRSQHTRPKDQPR